MSSLTDIIGRAIEACEVPGIGIDTHRAIEVAFPAALADIEARDALIREALSKRIKDAATRMQVRARDETASGPTIDLFGRLRVRYAIDTEGRRLKNTDDLSRLEFERIRYIRREQIAADAAHLAELDAAFELVTGIWDLHPDFTFGQCKAAVLGRRAA